MDFEDCEGEGGSYDFGGGGEEAEEEEEEEEEEQETPPSPPSKRQKYTRGRRKHDPDNDGEENAEPGMSTAEKINNSFEEFQWMYAEADPYEWTPPAEDRTTEEMEDEEFGAEAVLRRLTRQMKTALNIASDREAEPDDYDVRGYTSTWDGKYCYLCETAGQDKNPYRQTILSMLNLREDVNLHFLCHKVAHYYKQQLLSHIKQAWPPQAVAHHLAYCNKKSLNRMQRNMEMLAAYSEWIFKRALITDNMGIPQPLDNRDMYQHLRIMDATHKYASWLEGNSKKNKR